MDFRRMLVERLLIHLGEAEVPRGNLEAFASDVVHMIGRVTEERAYDATMRQILQRYAEESAEQSAGRLIEGGEDNAAETVFGMLGRQGRSRAVRACRRALLDALEGREPPADDLDFRDES
ncbi:MAG: hypothetical protein V3V62_13160 [bacterium]